MKEYHPLAGIYAAAITPLSDDHSIAVDQIPGYVSFLAQRGCHGALLLGTTGGGPSFCDDERKIIFKAATQVRQEYPDFRLLAGTGTPSLEETTLLTKFAFDLGYNGVVSLPPYYYHQANEDGIFYWFETLIQKAVPSDGTILGYHFPAQAGVPIPRNVLSRLRQKYPVQFSGIKDSTAEAEYTQQIGKNLDGDFVSLVGNDKLLLQSLDMGGSGCITAMANLFSPELRKIWEAYQNGNRDSLAQEFINSKRNVMNHYLPFPPSIKALVSKLYGFPLWPVKLPLSPLSPEKIEKAYQEISAD